MNDSDATRKEKKVFSSSTFNRLANTAYYCFNRQFISFQKKIWNIYSVSLGKVGTIHITVLIKRMLNP